MPPAGHFHPQEDDDGRPVWIERPSVPTPMAAWHDPILVATVTPGAAMPRTVIGIEIGSWLDAPTVSSGWEVLVAGCSFAEPQYEANGMRAASGAVVVEPDGRVWVVSPSNRFGGYGTTFPKGVVAAAESLCLRANAIKEVHEETGLQIELTGYLCDAVRTLSLTRYYVGRRIGGNPADMGWESQAVHLVPVDHLHHFVNHPFDQPIIGALRGYLLGARLGQPTIGP